MISRPTSIRIFGTDGGVRPRNACSAREKSSRPNTIMATANGWRGYTIHEDARAGITEVRLSCLTRKDVRLECLTNYHVFTDRSGSLPLQRRQPYPTLRK